VTLEYFLIDSFSFPQNKIKQCYFCVDGTVLAAENLAAFFISKNEAGKQKLVA